MIDIRRREDMLLPIWFLTAEAGHAGCGGWRWHGTQLRCMCGTALYELHVMDRQCGAPPASPPGPARKAVTDDPG